MVINSKVCSGQRSFATHVKVCVSMYKARESRVNRWSCDESITSCDRTNYNIHSLNVWATDGALPEACFVLDFMSFPAAPCFTNIGSHLLTWTRGLDWSQWFGPAENAGWLVGLPKMISLKSDVFSTERKHPYPGRLHNVANTNLNEESLDQWRAQKCGVFRNATGCRLVTGHRSTQSGLCSDLVWVMVEGDV